MFTRTAVRGLLPSLGVVAVLAALLVAPAPVGAAANKSALLAATPCATAGLASDKTSPQPAGAVITFTASSTVCTSPQYKFYVQNPGGTWHLARDYSATATLAWSTFGLAAGNYNVNVWARNTGSTAAVEANHIMPFSLTAPPACTAAGLTSDKASPQQVDFTVTFTATSATCPNPEYLFYLQSPNGKWTIARGYGGPTLVWDTSTLASIGTYNVNVWVRQMGSGVAVQTNHIIPFVINNRVCTGANLTANKTSPQAHGAVITFTATSASCARPEYLFYLKTPGTNGHWMVVKAYDGNTLTWNTAGVASIGTYQVNVWVRAIGSGVAVQTNFIMPFQLT